MTEKGPTAKCDDCGKFMNPTTEGTSIAGMYDFAAMEASYLKTLNLYIVEWLGDLYLDFKP